MCTILNLMLDQSMTDRSTDIIFADDKAIVIFENLKKELHKSQRAINKLIEWKIAKCVIIVNI